MPVSNSSQPAKTGSSRVFLIPWGARGDHVPQFEACMVAGGVSKSYGDATEILCPRPGAYNQFDVVGQIQAAPERATINLTGRYALDLASTMKELADRRCPFDVQVHFGQCTDPRVFNVFTKANIYEGSRIGTPSPDALGGLDADAAINEMVDLSFPDWYEGLPLTFQRKGDDVITNTLADVINCSSVSCGECADPDAGCDLIYAISLGDAGSAGTAPDIVYSIDGGQTLAADDIHSMAVGDNGDAVACWSDYVLAISNEDDAVHYKSKAHINAGHAGYWTRQAAGVVAAGSLMDMWSVGNYVFFCGDLGYVYGTYDPTVGITVLDAGVATDDNLLAIHAISETFAVAVGANAAIIYTENQLSWTAIAGPVGIADDFTAVWVKSEDEWWIGSDAGLLYYTVDRGATWAAKLLPVGLVTVNDVFFATESVGYIVAQATGATGSMLRTFDGGYSWVVLPEATGNLPYTLTLLAGAACTADPNLVVGVGVAGAGLDGVWLTGVD